MLISEISNRDDVLTSVIKELNGIGIKIRNEKHKQSNNKRRNKRIFNVSLHLLELDDGLLSNGSVAQIPKFVLMSCKRIRTELETEGIFRKTGSVKKQKFIQEQLEQGELLDTSHHVVDVANLLKTFFRQLPEPLIPPGPIQEGLLRCLFHFSSYEEKCEALLMTMLLLPPISVNTLAYFLQFLEVVIKNSHMNLMTTDNLVKVLTPTIMPVPLNAPQKRLTSHFKVVELLIENANLLGVVPDRMLKKANIPIVAPKTEERKKQKRRSGSLNRVFLGFKKIVGAMGSSSESLDKSEEILDDDRKLMTPVTKSSKKRPLDRLDISTFSSKKKKDLLMTLTSLPEIDDPNSPSITKNDTLKKRKSVGHLSEKECESPTKRRWSIVGGRFTRSRATEIACSSHNLEDTKNNVEEEVRLEARADDGYMKISKSEYEAFKCRLNSIETKISHEFHLTKLDAVKAEMGQDDSMMLNGPEKVQNKFNQTLYEVEKLGETERKTEQLARRLSRDLKIRPSIDHGVMLSPSARKIGSMRRRRDSTVRLSRNQSWHLGQASHEKLVTNPDATSTLVPTSSFYPKSNLKRAKPVQSTTHQVTSRPLPALPQRAQHVEKVVPEKPLRVKRESIDHSVTPLKTNVEQQEAWIPASHFFGGIGNEMEVDETQEKPQQDEEVFFKTPVRPKGFASVRSIMKNENNMVKTPMLSPRMTSSSKRLNTPSGFLTPRSMDFSATNRTLMLTPMPDGSNGRDSIINLRNQNAGMVAQKAKLFNGMSDKFVEKPPKLPRVLVNKNLETVKSMSFDDTPKKNRHNVSSASTRSPRKSPRSPSGINKRGQFKATPQLSLLKTIRECSESQKAKFLKPDVLSEITSPRQKPLSQHKSPRRVSKTPNRDSAKKRRHTPSKSPRFACHVQDSC